ncbi:hypothetical protein [Nonomuraea sp. NPDC049129]|uniref:hypothetical protein n=1 Tax=Nonomuraea sp. NPDC049129 TaxID=3155272 RepID=UPI0033E01F39
MNAEDLLAQQAGVAQGDDRLLVTISRADVAAFMHQAAHTGEWIHRCPVITD